MGERKSQKIGRNAPCPCGSQQKFKHCHGAIRSTASQAGVPDQLQRRLDEVAALRRRREQQQGLGRPIVSFTFDDYRIVAVRTRVLWSKSWRTFEDFLFSYIKHAVGPKWGQAELARPLADRHPILQCYDELCRVQRESGTVDGQIKQMVATGAVTVYLHLVS